MVLIFKILRLLFYIPISFWLILRLFKIKSEFPSCLENVTSVYTRFGNVLGYSEAVFVESIGNLAVRIDAFCILSIIHPVYTIDFRIYSNTPIFRATLRFSRRVLKIFRGFSTSQLFKTVSRCAHVVALIWYCSYTILRPITDVKRRNVKFTKPSAK